MKTVTYSFQANVWLIVRDVAGTYHITKNEFEFGLPMFTEYGYETKREAQRRLKEIVRNGESLSARHGDKL